MATLWDGLIKSIQSSSMTPAMKVACLAQAILESGRGTSKVCHECQNFWGMKMRPELAALAVGQEVPVISESEGRAVFAKFANIDIAVAGWLVFLSRPYYRGWQAFQDDAEGFIRHIGKSWCPRADYADTVIQLFPEALELLQMEMPQPPPPQIRLLKRGAKGEEVERLQQELNDHFDAELEVDGDFGRLTETAVKQVEEILGTVPDGIVDSDFWGALLTLEGIKKDITPVTPPKATDIPFAVRLKDIPTRFIYDGGGPTGAILHFTAGRDNPLGTVEYLAKSGFPCLVMGRDGQIYQPFPASCGGSHCGTHHHETSVGLEVISAGRCTPVVVDGVTKYAPWFAYKNGDPRTGVLSKPEDCFTEAEMRHVDRVGSRREGWYQIFTPAQEDSILKVFLWYKWADPTKRFDFAKVLGHDEACDQGGRPGAKNDPGGALSMTMPEFRSLLNQKWAELQAKTPAEQQAYFARP